MKNKVRPINIIFCLILSSVLKIISHLIIIFKMTIWNGCLQLENDILNLVLLHMDLRYRFLFELQVLFLLYYLLLHLVIILFLLDQLGFYHFILLIIIYFLLVLNLFCLICCLILFIPLFYIKSICLIMVF